MSSEHMLTLSQESSNDSIKNINSSLESIEQIINQYSEDVNVLSTDYNSKNKEEHLDECKFVLEDKKSNYKHKNEESANINDLNIIKRNDINVNDDISHDLRSIFQPDNDILIEESDNEIKLIKDNHDQIFLDESSNEIFIEENELINSQIKINNNNDLKKDEIKNPCSLDNSQNNHKNLEIDKNFINRNDITNKKKINVDINSTKIENSNFIKNSVDTNQIKNEYSICDRRDKSELTPNTFLKKDKIHGKTELLDNDRNNEAQTGINTIENGFNSELDTQDSFCVECLSSQNRINDLYVQNIPISISNTQKIDTKENINNDNHYFKKFKNSLKSSCDKEIEDYYFSSSLTANEDLNLSRSLKNKDMRDSKNNQLEANLQKISQNCKTRDITSKKSQYLIEKFNKTNDNSSNYESQKIKNFIKNDYKTDYSKFCSENKNEKVEFEYEFEEKNSYLGNKISKKETNHILKDSTNKNQFIKRHTEYKNKKINNKDKRIISSDKTKNIRDVNFFSLDECVMAFSSDIDQTEILENKNSEHINPNDESYYQKVVKIVQKTDKELLKTDFRNTKIIKEENINKEETILTKIEDEANIKTDIKNENPQISNEKSVFISIDLEDFLFSDPDLNYKNFDEEKVKKENIHENIKNTKNNHRKKMTNSLEDKENINSEDLNVQNNDINGFFTPKNKNFITGFRNGNNQPIKIQNESLKNFQSKFIDSKTTKFNNDDPQKLVIQTMKNYFLPECEIKDEKIFKNKILEDGLNLSDSFMGRNHQNSIDSQNIFHSDGNNFLTGKESKIFTNRFNIKKPENIDKSESKTTLFNKTENNDPIYDNEGKIYPYEIKTKEIPRDQEKTFGFKTANNKEIKVSISNLSKMKSLFGDDFHPLEIENKNEKEIESESNRTRIKTGFSKYKDNNTEKEDKKVKNISEMFDFNEDPDYSLLDDKNFDAQFEKIIRENANKKENEKKFLYDKNFQQNFVTETKLQPNNNKKSHPNEGLSTNKILKNVDFCDNFGYEKSVVKKYDIDPQTKKLTDDNPQNLRIETCFMTANNKRICVKEESIKKVKENTDSEIQKNIFEDTKKTEDIKSNKKIDEQKKDISFTKNKNENLLSIFSNNKCVFKTQDTTFLKQNMPGLTSGRPMRSYNRPELGHYNTKLRYVDSIKKMYNEIKNEYFKKMEDGWFESQFKWSWLCCLVKLKKNKIGFNDFAENNDEGEDYKLDINEMKDLLIKELVKRKDKEYSILRRIVEGDDVSSKYMKLMVISIKKDFLELYDGWYSLNFEVDSEIMLLIENKKIKVGTVLKIFAAELLIEPGESILDMNKNTKSLKINYNSVKISRFTNNLGYQKKPCHYTFLKYISKKGGIISGIELEIKKIISKEVLIRVGNFARTVEEKNVECEVEKINEMIRKSGNCQDLKWTFTNFMKCIMKDANADECLFSWFNYEECKVGDKYRFMFLKIFEKDLGIHLCTFKKSYFQVISSLKAETII